MNEITIRMSNKVSGDVIINTSMTALVENEDDAERAGEDFYKMFMAITRGFNNVGENQ